MSRIILWGVLLASAGLAQGTHAVVRSIGQFDSDGTVFYSVYIATRSQVIEEVVISSALPPGTRFLENVDLPRGARYEGVADNVVAWTIPALAADTLLGPFTYRVRLDGTRREVPAAAAAAVAYQRPVAELVEFPAGTAALVPLADTGSITFDARGTLSAQGENTAVAVGATGILIFVPAEAVARTTTLTFRRHPVEEGRVPSSAAGTWWCGLYEVTVDPAPANAVLFSKTVTYALPMRRPLTPGLIVSSFLSANGSDWQEEKPTAERGLGFGGFGSGGCFTQFGFSTCGGFGFGFGGFGAGFGFGAFGVRDADRVAATVSGTTLGQFGLPPSAAQTITDGTSNTINAILVGRR